MECQLCKPDSSLIVKNFQNWIVSLHKNQAYLGRCIVSLKRHETDLMDINPAEIQELFLISKKLKLGLKDLFQPDLFNYVSSGNSIRHLRLDVIPRYKGKRNFKNVQFQDVNFGKNYSPYNKQFEIPTSAMVELRKVIRQKVEK